MSAPAEQRSTTYFLVGIVPYFDLLERTDPARATRLAARMQQVLGEAALLADGTIVDSLGSRFVARFAAPLSAVDALRFAASAIAEQNEGRSQDDLLEPAVLADCDETAGAAGSLAPSSLAFVDRVLASMEPGQVLLTASLAHAAGVLESAPRAGSMNGIDLYGVPLEAAPPETRPAGPEPAQPDPIPKRASGLQRFSPAHSLIPIGVAAAVFVAALAAIVLWSRGDDGEPAAQVAAAPAVQADSRPAVLLEAFAAPSDDPDETARAAALEEAVRRMLAESPELRLLEAPATKDARRFGVRRVEGEEEDALVAFGAGMAAVGPRVSLEESGRSAAAIAEWIAEQSGVSVAGAEPEALEKFVEAIAASRESDARSRTRAAAAAAAALEADPDFVPAARLALGIATESGDRAAAIVAAGHVVRLDPEDLDTRQALAGWLIEEDRRPDALRLLGPIVASGSDRDLIVFAAHEALSAGDEDSFRRLLPAVSRVAGPTPPLHEPDVLVAQGRLGVAAAQYYEIERQQANNAALALKIGRIAVLRHSMSMAQLQVGKLERLDPEYGAPLLRAFIAAETGDAAAAAADLERAASEAPPGSDFHTAAAEIHAILGNHAAVLASLRRAVTEREPSFAYILSNPLFAYLKDDGNFSGLRSRMIAAQNETREALAELR